MSNTPNPTAAAVIAEARKLGQRGWYPLAQRNVQRLLIECTAALAAQPVLDPEKVAKVVCDAIEGNESDTPHDMVAARALCEAYTEGKLT